MYDTSVDTITGIIKVRDICSRALWIVNKTAGKNYDDDLERHEISTDIVSDEIHNKILSEKRSEEVHVTFYVVRPSRQRSNGSRDVW